MPAFFTAQPASSSPKVVEGLFTHQDAIRRHLSAPMLIERQAYLGSLLAMGRKRKHVCAAAAMVCHVIELIKPAKASEVSELDIEEAAKRWVAGAMPSPIAFKSKREEAFKAVARSWFRFLGLYVRPNQPQCHFRTFHAAFVAGLREDHGLLPSSIRASSMPALRFLVWVTERHEHLSAINLTDIDAYLGAGRARGWTDRTVQGICQALRKLFRYAEHRGWSYAGLSKTIRAPMGNAGAPPLPFPRWKEIRRMINNLDAAKPSLCRAKAVLLLAAVYGMRSCEISNLMLEDLDWRDEILTIRRAKHGGVQQFPLQYEVGEAIIRYLRDVRPPSKFRNVFLTLKTPHEPTRHLAQSMWRLLRLGAFLDSPCGLHSLRHACATELLRKGTSLKAIADFLGHRSMRSVSIYAHCDMRSLRKVARFSLKDVL